MRLPQFWDPKYWIGRLARPPRALSRRRSSGRRQVRLTPISRAREFSRRLLRRRTKTGVLGDDQFFIFRILRGAGLRLQFHIPVMLRHVSRRLSWGGAFNLNLFRRRLSLTSVVAARPVGSRPDLKKASAHPLVQRRERQLETRLERAERLLLQSRTVDRSRDQFWRMRERTGWISREFFLGPARSFLFLHRPTLARHVRSIVAGAASPGAGHTVVETPRPFVASGRRSPGSKIVHTTTVPSIRFARSRRLPLLDRLTRTLAIREGPARIVREQGPIVGGSRVTAINRTFLNRSRTGAASASPGSVPRHWAAAPRVQPPREGIAPLPPTPPPTFPVARTQRTPTPMEPSPPGRTASLVFADAPPRPESPARRQRTQEEEELLVRRIQRKLEEETLRVERKINEKVVSPQEMTDQIYSRLTRRLQIEKERLGY